MKTEEGKIIENIDFTFTPQFKITEGADEGGKSWLSIGGIALVEGVSKNKNRYTFKNLEENSGRAFKWLVGHPDEPEEHVVGKGQLILEGTKLLHEGKIRNTARHPDIIEQVKDGFLGPSIHATADKVTHKEGYYEVEGLNIDGVGLVAFQGVKQATIDYAIAESFSKKMSEMTESSGAEDVQNATRLNHMEEKTKVVDAILELNSNFEKEQLLEKSLEELQLIESYEQKLNVKEEEVAEPAAEEPAEEPAAEAPAEEEKEEEAEEEAEAETPAEEPAKESDDRLKVLEAKIEQLEMEKKQALVESILKINGDLESEKLMSMTESQLVMVKDYESKLQTTESHAVVDNKALEESYKFSEGKYGYSMAEKSWQKFNDEIREQLGR